MLAEQAPVLRTLAEQPSDDPDWTRKTHTIGQVTVYGARPMAQIGVQRTHLDTTALKEHVALSMADVLTFNSSVFVKSHGRASVSTVAFRGTSPAHTQVTWNGMRINNPMLGMTDFSLIPAYFIDDASLLHGTSSIGQTGGGLGGAVTLATKPATGRGFGLQYIQGIGSFGTFDEFLRLTYGNDRWQLATRIAHQYAKNDYKFRNPDKKENIYDDDHHIIGQYHPVQRNRNGAFADLHILQEAYYTSASGDRFGLNAWYVDSRHELPQLTTEYGDASDFERMQRENTFRGILSWDRIRNEWKLGAKAGYVHTWTAYDYDTDNGSPEPMERTRNTIDTFYALVEGEYAAGEKWLFTGSFSAHRQWVESTQKIEGYTASRTEFSVSVSAKWQPVERLGLAAVVREERFGSMFSPPIPALFADGVLSRKGNITAKASVSKNYRFPTLNDLYFQPGGNPDLRPERGWSYDAGLSFAVGGWQSWMQNGPQDRSQGLSLAGSITWFESHIDDWILWLPSTKGFYFSPRNLKKVHAYGIESQVRLSVAFAKDWAIDMSGTYAWTPSVNRGERLSPADRSVGEQLPYVPRLSASLSGLLAYRTWSLMYKWNRYSRRYTMSSSDVMLSGDLPAYGVSNATLAKRFSLAWADLSLKATVNNLFDTAYMSVLSHPMPGINFEIFFGITPKWGKK